MASAVIPDPGQTYMTLRLPRGLLQDLEETVIQQDRQFLTEVGLSLGLSRAEITGMIRQVLGTGALQPMPVLWATSATTPNFCPWWECRGDGLWRPCPRHRISPSLPCAIHERSVPCPLTRLDSDPIIKDLPQLQPISHRGRMFWISPDATICYNEDGTIPTDGAIRFINRKGERVPVFASTEALALLDEKI